MSEEIVLKSKFPSYEIPIKSVGEFLWEKIQKLDENQVLFIEANNGTKITVKEFISQVNSMATALLKRGITKSDIICCSSTNSLSNAVIEMTAYFLGITLIPLCPIHAKNQIEEDIKNIGLTIIFTSVKDAIDIDDLVFDSCGHQVFDQIKIIIVFDGKYKNYLSFEKLLKEEKDERLEKIPYFHINPKNDIFIVMKTSGTTGTPKSAIYTHYTALAILLGSLRLLPDKSIALMNASMGHVSGLMTLINQIICGNTIVLFEGNDEDLTLRSIEKYKINLFAVFPGLTRKLIEGELVDKYDLSSVNTMVISWRATPVHVINAIFKKYNVQIIESYGMTEYPRLCSHLIKNITVYIPGSVGFISANTELKIVDINRDESLGPNAIGEICVRGPKMFSGYLNDEKATKEVIDSDGWLHTGDIGHYDENERLYVIDRRSQTIRYFSSCGIQYIYPAELELLLESHESVAEVAVVGVKHKTETQWPRAYVKLKESKKASEDDLIKFVADSMSFAKQLRAFVIFVDKIPKVYTGKINRKYFNDLVQNEIID